MLRTLRLLRWLYVGRLTIAAGIFTGAVFAWTGASADTTLVATLALLVAVAVTGASLWYTAILGRTPGQAFLYGQILLDTLLVTAIVHITTIENAPSDFSALYVLVIAAAALLLPLPGGLIAGVLTSLIYFADVLWLLPYSPTPSTFYQIGLFAMLAMVTGALGHRLRRAGAALGQVESELRQLKLDTNDILAAIDTGLVTVDDEGRLVHINQAASRLLTLEAKHWRGKSVLEELDRRAPGLGTVIRRTANTNVPVRRHELRVPSVVGEQYLGLRTTLLERAEKPWVTAVIQDVTESKQIDDLIRRAERLQAIGELGASLAHEIKNPLASIRSAVEQLARDRLSSEDREVLRKLVLTESERLGRLLAEFMEFSRVELKRWRVVDLREVATDAIGMVAKHPDAGVDTTIQFEPPAEALIVDGDEDLLHRAVFNLVLNGVQHAGPHGRVRVEMGRVEAFDVPASVALDAPVRLTVRDSGPGIQESDVTRLFDPFFTTRDGGNGLGLAMVHRAIEAHRGAIVVDGSQTDGARFTVYLPAHNGTRS